jgi:hypothetical protein
MIQRDASITWYEPTRPVTPLSHPSLASLVRCMADTDVVLGSDEEEYSQNTQQWNAYAPSLRSKRAELDVMRRRSSGEPLRKRIKVGHRTRRIAFSLNMIALRSFMNPNKARPLPRLRHMMRCMNHSLLRLLHQHRPRRYPQHPEHSRLLTPPTTQLTPIALRL